MDAEYIGISEVCQEILFVKLILEFLRANVVYPIVVHVDNQGTIFLAKNEGASMQMKHVDVCYHFVREHVEDSVVKIIFVQLEENDVDLFTKNTGWSMFEKHLSKFMVDHEKR